MSLHEHAPHPHLESRAQQGPIEVTVAHVNASTITRFNTHAAVIVTHIVGTMWCAYAFAALALYGLPAALRNGSSGFVQWASSQFIQLVLLPIILVGGNVIAEATDRMNKRQFDDVEVILHEQSEQAAHLAAQDKKIISIEEKILTIVTALQENTVISIEARDAAIAAGNGFTIASATRSQQ